MAWNNDDDGPQGPWGRPPQNPQQPDMEKIIQVVREQLLGGSRGGEGGSGKKNLPLFMLVGFVIWMATGIYVVGPDEEGIVMRFGKFVQSTSPGPHFHLPYPIETIYRPKVTQIQRLEVGFRTRNRTMVDVEAESLMLTGDENIIDIDLSIQFRISNAADFLFNTANPTDAPYKVVMDAAESAIRQVIGRNSIDEALTVGKDKIQEQAKSTTQEILDSYKSGIQVVAVQLQEVSPPTEVIHAFKDVASAREDRERMINEAQGYANDILPKAKGEAAKMVQEAEANKTAKVARARGESERFLALLSEYNRSKEITRARLYLETMEEILAGMNKVVIGSNTTSEVLPYLPLERRPAPQTSTGGK